MSEDTLNTVRTICEASGLADDLCSELGRFAELLIKHGKKVNLIGTLDAERVAGELLLDSLELLKALPDADAPRVLVDIGSGAGIPGIPLLLARRSWEGVLVEPRVKRARFLQHAARDLQLSDRVQVQQLHWHGGRLQSNSTESSMPRIWVSRAVLAPDEWLVRSTSSAAAGDEIVVWTNGAPGDVPLEGEPIATHTYEFGDARQRSIRVFRVA